ncbi:MAG TPA: pitrilysin family protein [Rhizomicrobium sp.]|jgi:zinc protease|nr:pitrilysin family protein [Rhizomicrobium sp.]
MGCSGNWWRRGAQGCGLAAIALAANLLLIASSRADETGVLRATLDNGLRVVIVRNTLAPVVSTSVNYLVGSDEAPAGFPGMAHAQEHMMFRGSSGLSADQLAVIGSEMGGDFNADTTQTMTQYLFTVPAADLDIVLHVEALRMADATDSQQGWTEERGAIEQEVSQDVSSPEYNMYDRLRAAMFAGTAYAHDALGTRDSFEHTTSAMLKDFHDAWYAPNNAILVVVGDIDPRATLEKIKSFFGPLKAKSLPARPEMTFRAVDSTPIQLETDRPVATQMLALRLPGLDSPDFPALELLADILDSRRFALRGLVAQGKGIDAGFSLDPLPKASIGYASLSVPEAPDTGAAEREIAAILANVARDGVPAELLAAAKIQEHRQAEFRKNSIDNLASDWSDATALWGLQSPNDDLARIDRVTPEQIDAVARKYLDLNHAVPVTMIPREGEKPPVAEHESGKHESLAVAEPKPTVLPDWAQSGLARLAVPQSTLHPVVSILPNGLTLIVQPEDVSDTVSVYGHVQNRPETETVSGKDGVAQVLDALFNYGTQHLDRIAFQKALDDIGASEHAGPDFGLQTLSQDFDRGMSLLADNELHPELSNRPLGIAREQLGEMVGARLRSPAFLASRALRESLFAKGDPSLREPLPDSIAGLTVADVARYYGTAFRPDLTTIVVIGKITPEEARRVVEKYFGGWQAVGPRPDIDLPAAPANRSAALTVPDASRLQDTVALAENFPLSRRDPDFYALQLGNAVLAGGFYSSRLSIDLRKKTGLVYSVDAELQSGKTRSVYLVSYACDPGNVGKAAGIVSHELADLQATPMSEDELMRAKAFLLRQIPLEEASVEAIADVFNTRRDLGLPLDESTIAANYYVAMSTSDVQAAFRKWIRPDDLVRVSQGPTPH